MRISVWYAMFENIYLFCVFIWSVVYVIFIFRKYPAASLCHIKVRSIFVATCLSRPLRALSVKIFPAWSCCRACSGGARTFVSLLNAVVKEGGPLPTLSKLHRVFPQTCSAGGRCPMSTPFIFFLPTPYGTGDTRPAVRRQVLEQLLSTSCFQWQTATFSLGDRSEKHQMFSSLLLTNTGASGSGSLLSPALLLPIFLDSWMIFKLLPLLQIHIRGGIFHWKCFHGRFPIL